MRKSIKPAYKDGNPSVRILVEGPGDFHFLYQWLDAEGLLGTCCFEPVGGIDDLLNVFPVVLKESGLQSLALIVDSDTSTASHWQAIRDRALSFGYSSAELPHDLPSEGFVLSSDDLPNFAVWIMPDNGGKGYLEHFIAELVKPSDPLWFRAVEYVDCLPTPALKLGPNQVNKAYVHSYLAVCSEPGIPIGVAVKIGLFDRLQPLGVKFSRWISAFLNSNS